MNMGPKATSVCFIFAFLAWEICALPTSLLNEIKASEQHSPKVKRSQPVKSAENIGENVEIVGNPSANKRDASNLSPQYDFYQPRIDDDVMSNDQSPLYIPGDQSNFNEKLSKLTDDEKNFAFNRDYYMPEPSFLDKEGLPRGNYGGYVGGYYGEERRRKRAVNVKTANRKKRELELTPEEVLTLLTLYEANQHYDEDSNPQTYEVNDPDEEEDEHWYNHPVHPHVNERYYNYDTDSQPKHKPKVIFRENAANYDQYDHNNPQKRFMVHKKRNYYPNNDPTREIRYINGPAQSDYYTLSQLLQNQREPTVPVYRRFIL